MSVRPEFARALAWTRLAGGLRGADHDLYGSISMAVALAFAKARHRGHGGFPRAERQAAESLQRAWRSCRREPRRVQAGKRGMMAEETPAQGPEIVLNASLAAKRAATAALKAKTAEPPVSEAPKPNGAAPATADIAVTWASTDPLERIGKRWVPTGKWPVTSGVRSAAYRFKRTTTPPQGLRRQPGGAHEERRIRDRIRRAQHRHQSGGARQRQLHRRAMLPP